MKTINLKKTLKHLYTASAKKPSVMEVPSLSCLMIDGTGDPNGRSFQEAVGTLYTVGYTMKFTFKKEKNIDYPVMACEGLWDAGHMNDFASGNRDAWKWTIFMVLPDVVTKKDVGAAVAAAKEKAKFPRFPEVRLEKLSEGLCVQIMHIGPYSAETPTIKALHAFAEDQGYALRGLHHEIYLSDPRRSAPEKLKTIIRRPCSPAASG